MKNVWGRDVLLELLHNYDDTKLIKLLLPYCDVKDNVFKFIDDYPLFSLFYPYYLKNVCRKELVLTSDFKKYIILQQKNSIKMKSSIM